MLTKRQTSTNVFTATTADVYAADGRGENTIDGEEENRRLRGKLAALAALACTPPDGNARSTSFASEARDALDARIAIVHRLHGEGELEIVACDRDMEVDEGWLKRIARRMAEEVIARGEMFNLGDCSTFYRASDFDAGAKINRYLAAPLRNSDKEIIGVAAIFSTANVNFTEDDEWWLTIAASLLGEELSKTNARSIPVRPTVAAAAPQATRAASKTPPDLMTTAPAFFAAQGTSEHTGKSKGNVLVIDDDKAFNHVLCGFLRDEGYKAESAFDGLEAVRLFRPHAFDVVMTDVAMPHMNGWELIAALRMRAPEIPIILVTAYSSVMWNENHLRQHNVAAVLNKPFQLERLRSTLAELVKPELSAA